MQELKALFKQVTPGTMLMYSLSISVISLVVTLTPHMVTLQKML